MQENGYLPYFTEICAEKYNLPLDKITPFFKGPFQLCQKGESDLKVAIKPYLDEFHWPLKVDDYLQEWFQSDNQINDELINYISEIKNKGVQCHLATDQEKYRAEYIAKKLDFENIFDTLFFSFNLKTSKSDPAFFKLIIQELQLNPSQILYFDDEIENVASAKSVGVEAYIYESFSQAKTIIDTSI